LKTWLNNSWSAAKGGRERGKDYNHSTFIDLIISGLIGLIPKGSDVLQIVPLIPAGTWKWFAVDRLKYRGRYLTIVWDEDGSKYGVGAGFRIFVNYQLLVAATKLGPIRTKLPPMQT
jgi:hypothetical protein